MSDLINCTPNSAFVAFQKNALEMAYTPDLCNDIDTEEEILADELNCSIHVARNVLIMMRQARIDERENNAASSRELFSIIISKILESDNPRASLFGLACAGGLDQLNELHTQADVGRHLGCSRALVSHYTTAWADLLSGKQGDFTITKYRKSDASRETFAKKATNPYTQRKKEKIRRFRANLSESGITEKEFNN